MSSAEVNEVRFAFGANWQRFLELLNEDRIIAAEESLQTLSGLTDFTGKSVLDLGCGSGLFSLAAKRLGASVVSVDYDADSVACTQYLKDKFFSGDDQWQVIQGSALSEKFSDDFTDFDVVYSWGVLHHTGNMQLAIDNALSAVGAGGRFATSIYNDQGWLSRYWLTVKKLFHTNVIARWAMIAVHAPYLVVARYIVRLATGRVKLERGMSYWYDMLDWLGGLPFEVAKPEEILDAVQGEGFYLAKMRTCGGRSGCNEFLFIREQDTE